MQFYLLVSVLTLLIAFMSVLVWLKTRTAAFLIGFAVLYYWTLYGAWYVIRERQAVSAEYGFQYLYYKMFPVYLDRDYFLSLVLYGAFILTVQLIVLIFTKRIAAPEAHLAPVEMSHLKLITLCGICTVLAYLIIRNGLAEASSLDRSGYVYVAESTPFFTLYQILNEAALISGAFGLTVWLSGDRAIYLHAKRTFAILICYLALLGSIFHIDTLLGTRSTLVFACITAGLFYLANTKRRNLKLMLLGGLVAYIVVVVPGIARDPYKMQDLRNTGSFLEALKVLGGEAQSLTEATAAHFSMYGVLHNHVPLTYGSSFVSLLASLVPRVIWAGRPEDIYSYYARQVRSIEGQGYTIHHATAWYLNFGLIGVILGAALLGWIWSLLFNRFGSCLLKDSHFSHILSITGFFSFTGFLATFIRDGPEGYKGVIVESLLLPALVVSSATLTVVLRSNRPFLVAAKPGFESLH